MPAVELASRWSGRTGSTLAFADPIEALSVALDRAGPIVVAGSLYLVGAVRAELVDDPDLRDPDPVEDA
jgi:folylpolyglutamate synthase/dihydropteroate synthase